MARHISRMWILKRLVAAGLLTPAALADFTVSLASSGGNLAALLRFAARRRKDAIALVNAEDVVSFAELAAQCERMAAALRDVHGVKVGAPVGVLCRNGSGLVRGVFAAARLGARVTLLNPEMSAAQLPELMARHNICVVIVEADTESLVTDAAGVTVLDAGTLLAAAPASFQPIGRVSGGELVVLTGGTTGPPKAARRRPKVGNFLRLFLHLVAVLGLDRHPAAYVAVPLFHGYGIAAFLVATALGRTVYLTRKFEAEAANALIARDGIAVVAVVPSMLQRMLAAPGDLSAIRCVIIGGAALSAKLAVETRERLGDVLFNLYGTSEAGVAMFATPEDLAAAPGTIGREIWGVTVTIRDEAGAALPDGQAGRLCIESSAAVARDAWIETGDLGLRDVAGRLFVHGRADDMVVSGGEKVNPWDVETVLRTHPDVRECAAIGVADPDFGQRMVAFVVPAAGSALTPETLLAWLNERVARYQRPRSITFRQDLPLTAIGKVNKRALAAMVTH